MKLELSGGSTADLNVSDELSGTAGGGAAASVTGGAALDVQKVWQAAGSPFYYYEAMRRYPERNPPGGEEPCDLVTYVAGYLWDNGKQVPLKNPEPDRKAKLAVVGDLVVGSPLKRLRRVGVQVRPRLVSATGEPAVTTGGLPVAVGGRFDPADKTDMLIVIAGFGARHAEMVALARDAAPDARL